MAVVASETFTATSAPIQYAAVEAFLPNAAIEAYLDDARRILRAIGRRMHQQLERHEVFAPKPQGGFYLFPNFGFYKNSLQKRGMANSYQFCEQLLNDTGVALLPSHDFGQPQEELTARLSYVDFDGAHALQLAREAYRELPLDNGFVDACCADMLDAVERLGHWLKG